MKNVALILIGLGVLVLIGWAIRGFFVSEDIPLPIKIAAGAIGLGVLVLIGTIIKERRTSANDEKFKEVKN